VLPAWLPAAPLFVLLLLLQVSNSLITPQEYEKAKTRAARTGAKFITKGDVQQALEKLQHARR
jgi:histone H3/H4